MTPDGGEEGSSCFLQQYYYRVRFAGMARVLADGLLTHYSLMGDEVYREVEDPVLDSLRVSDNGAFLDLTAVKGDRVVVFVYLGDKGRLPDLIEAARQVLTR